MSQEARKPEAPVTQTLCSISQAKVMMMDRALLPASI